MVSAKPCCERCERKFRNQRKSKNRYISALFRCWAKPSFAISETKFRNLRNLETALISMLQKELDRKNEQLSVKDKQIEELNARLAEISSALVVAQQTAQAAQALHAGTIWQQLTDGDADPDVHSQEPEEGEEKKGWLSRLFGR